MGAPLNSGENETKGTEEVNSGGPLNSGENQTKGTEEVNSGGPPK